MSEIKISDEALQKAFELLDQATGFTKSEDDKPEIEWEADNIKKGLDFAAGLVKGGLENETAINLISKGCELDADLSKSVFEKALESKESAEEKETAPASNDEGKEDLKKGLEALGIIARKLQEQNEALQQDNIDLKKSNEKLSEKFEAFLKQSQGRKSIPTAAYVDKFSKGEESTSISDENCFDISKSDEVNRLKDRLFSEFEKISDDVNKANESAILEKSIMSIETVGKIPETSYKYLSRLGIKLQVPSK